MRIIILTGIVNERSAAKVSIRLAQQFRLRGHTVKIIAEAHNSDREFVKILKSEGIAIRLIASGRGRLSKYLKVFTGMRDIRNFKPDIIYANCDFPLFLAGRLSLAAPVVSTFNHLQTTRHNLVEELKLGYRTISIYERLFSLAADAYIFTISFLQFFSSGHVVAGSNFSKREVKKLGARKVSSAYWGVDSFKGEAETLMRKPGGEIWILSVSRLVPYKRFHLLINSFKKVKNNFPEAKLIIVGTFGSAAYKRYLLSLHKDVLFLDSVSQGDLGFLYKNCDLYATASSKEGFGLTIVEAGLYSKPSVAFNHSALPEVILHGKTGYLAKNEHDFSEYLEKMVRDPGLRVKMGRAAGEYAKKFSWERCAKEYEKLFEKILM